MTGNGLQSTYKNADDRGMVYHCFSHIHLFVAKPEVSRLAALTLLPLVASLQLQSDNSEAIGASEAEFRHFIAQHQRTGIGLDGVRLNECYSEHR